MGTTPIWPVPEGEVFLGGLLEILQKKKILRGGGCRRRAKRGMGSERRRALVDQV
jgi:hypothetical protein